MSSPLTKEFASGCWISDSSYEGPMCMESPPKFIIVTTLEPGAEKYFSGFRVLIGCNNMEKKLPALKISDNADINTLCHRRRHAMLEQAKQSQLEAQEHGFELAKKWAEGDPCVTTSLPLCTLMIEIAVDDVGVTSLILHSPLETMESQSLCKLYDYVELCTPTSKSCVLFLRIGPFPRINGSKYVDALASTLVLESRVLPPPACRRPFVNLPEEMLHMIFYEAKMDSKNWRELMLSLALVCRAWSHPALDNLYEDFGYDSEAKSDAFLYPPRLVKTLEHYPALGKKIRVLRTNKSIDDEALYLENAKTIFTILQAAKNITQLYLSGTHRVLAQDFLHTICSRSNVRELVCRDGCTEFSYVYLPNIGDILRCLSHWPRLCKLIVSAAPSAITLDDLPTSTCTITYVTLHSMSLDLSQLRLLTTSWKSALREARIIGISGLTNEDIRMWLSEVGPTLEILSLCSTHPNHRSNNEEYALDAMLPVMSNLVSLILEGDVASHLVLERFSPTSNAIPGRQYILRMENLPAVNLDRLLNALNTTAWTDIFERDLLWDHGELIEQARKIATRRNICIT